MKLVSRIASQAQDLRGSSMQAGDVTSDDECISSENDNQEQDLSIQAFNVQAGDVASLFESSWTDFLRRVNS